MESRPYTAVLTDDDEFGASDACVNEFLLISPGENVGNGLLQCKVCRH